MGLREKIKSFNDTHPECPVGKRFLMNTDGGLVERWKLQTATVGEVAYDDKGNPLGEIGQGGLKKFVPIFVSLEEYDRVWPAI